jgi:regulator of sirC expression with transglutaminase-like and TPR domain
MTDRQEPERPPERPAELLARLGRSAGDGEGKDTELPVAEAALAFAALARPALDTALYHTQLAEWAREVAALAPAGATLTAAHRALIQVLCERAGFTGDTETYDDLDNADLARVIDRRRGLPVALGILWMAIARAQGWHMVGLGFPGHFLIRLELGGERLILDPFANGVACDAARLRVLLKAIGGGEGELGAEHYQPVADREVLLRLQNNLKLRLIQAADVPRALGVVEGMLLLAPGDAGLWREAGLLNAHLGQLSKAQACLETSLQHAADALDRERTLALLAQIRGQLN